MSLREYPDWVQFFVTWGAIDCGYTVARMLWNLGRVVVWRVRR